MRIIEQIRVLMLDQRNKDISMFENKFILSSIEERCRILDLESVTLYPTLFEQELKEAKKFEQLLNNTFTQFFRDSLNFSFLEKFILPELIKRKSKKGEIRIWSAGCSTGQEAYSLAILLHEQLNLNDECRFRILATDYSPNVLEVARKGVYSRESLRNVKLKIVDKYFDKVGDNYALSSLIKESVVFSLYDLLDANSSNPPDSIYGDFDIIMCSNVMFYYNPVAREFMLTKFKKALANQGYLITGDAENTFIKGTSGLKLFNLMSSIYQKTKTRYENENEN